MAACVPGGEGRPAAANTRTSDSHAAGGESALAFGRPLLLDVGYDLQLCCLLTYVLVCWSVRLLCVCVCVCWCVGVYASVGSQVKKASQVEKVGHNGGGGEMVRWDRIET